jgi:hypothetical protein
VRWPTMVSPATARRATMASSKAYSVIPCPRAVALPVPMPAVADALHPGTGEQTTASPGGTSSAWRSLSGRWDPPSTGLTRS